MGRFGHIVPAIERVIDAHEVDVHNVVHQQEEFGLCSWRLCDELMHSLKRWHCRSVLAEVAPKSVAQLVLAV